MALMRITQNMMTERSMTAMQSSYSRLAKIQEQASTGKMLNRPSDNPADSTQSMRTRADLADQRQYQRNAQDGDSWMTLSDTAMDNATQTLNRARDLATQAMNGAANSPQSREAIAVEIDVLREHLIGIGNTTYLDRPIFGGTTAGNKAFDSTGAYIGDNGAVMRTIADNNRVRVDVNGPDAFGSAFANLAQLSTELRAGNLAGVSNVQGQIKADTDHLVQTRASMGATHRRVQTAQELATDAELRLTSALAGIEDVDLPMTLINLKSQEVAYQAALQSTARVIQPSLMDFLRG